jgi:amidohydrolase
LIAALLATLSLLPPLSDEAALAAGIARELPRTLAFRRTIHANPELGEREKETAKLVAARLKELGLAVREGVAGPASSACSRAGSRGRASRGARTWTRCR